MPPKKTPIEPPYRFTRKRAQTDKPARLTVEIRHPYLKGIPVVIETTKNGWEQLFLEGAGDPEALFGLLVVPGYEEAKKDSPRGMHSKTPSQRKFQAEARKYAVALCAYADHWLSHNRASWPRKFSSLAKAFDLRVITYQDGPKKGSLDPQRIAFEAWKRRYRGRLPKPLSPPGDVIDFRANYLHKTSNIRKNAVAILQYYASKKTVDGLSVMGLLKILV